MPKPHDDRDEHQCRIADARDPAAGHEGVQIGIVGVLGKVFVELQRADPERQIERHLRAEDVPSEPAEAALVVALIETRALLEHVADGIERQQHRDQHHHDDGRDHRHHDDARALLVRPAGQHHQRQHEDRGDGEPAPGGARKRQQHRERHDAERDGAAERLAETVGDDALQREQRRKDQERAEHVRVLDRCRARGHTASAGRGRRAPG